MSNVLPPDFEGILFVEPTGVGSDVRVVTMAQGPVSRSMNCLVTRRVTRLVCDVAPARFHGTADEPTPT